jgi:ABC-type branched-subunit amino acid transport system substrate-binding protein
MSWIGPALLAIVLGCTVGEGRPDAPAPPPPAEAAGERIPADRPADAAVETAARELLTDARMAYDAGELDAARALTGRILRDYPATGAAAEARWLAARAAFGEGRYQEARELAEGYAAAQPAGSESAADARRLVELATDALAQPAASPVIGALLPRTGSRVLVQYGDWVLEGIQLALRESERRNGRSVQLVVADDGGGTRTGEAMAELQRRGAVAIIGPLMPQNLPAAVGARATTHLLMVSPTIGEAPTHWSNIYSVVGGDTRGAEELARYASQVGLADAAVLHARGPEYERRANAFIAEYQARGGRIRITVPYDSGTTTFGPHMGRILAGVRAGDRSRPFALFVAAPDRDVPQIAPQISYYGLDAAGAQVLGEAGWASPPVLRLVPGRDLEGVVAASPLPAGRADGVADPDFVALFERTYRRSLNNSVPALGFDAAYLVLQALPNRALTPLATSRRFELLAGIPGATGTLSVRGGRIVRVPHLVVIRNSELVPAAEAWDYHGPSRHPAPSPVDRYEERRP